MNEREAFIRAICEEPADDVRRLAFADWCDENGEPEYAEFIRVQIEVAPFCTRPRGGVSAIPSHRCKVCAALWVLWPDDGGWSLCSADCGACCDNARMLEQIEPLAPAVIDLFCRESNKLVAHSREWFGNAIPGGTVSNWTAHSPIPYFVLPGSGDFANIEITRGFISEVSLPLEAFAGEGVRCFACAAGLPDYETGVIECRRCDSTGILCEPLAADLFAKHPIQRVTLDGVVRDGIVFRTSTSNGHDNDIPSDVWAELQLPRCDVPGERQMRGTHTHMTEEELSRYLVAYGRKLAGLPPLAQPVSA